VRLAAFGLGLAVLSAAALPAQDLPQWVRQIARIKLQEKQNLQHIPNYVCSETVERARKKAKSAFFERLDTLRFDVAHVGNKDLLALPGAGGFEDTDLSKFVSEGTLGVGEFSSSAINLFVNDLGRFMPREKGNGMIPGLLAFDFEIPEFRSGWVISSQGSKAVVGSRGTIWVDPETLELQRLEENAVDIPSALGMKAVQTTIDYAKVRIGNLNVRLPSGADTLLTNASDEQHQNIVTFSACREFVSESSIQYDAPAAPPVKKK
jgi:hypothetical protein